MNVQLLDHDTPPKDAVKVWLKLEAEAEKLGLNVDLEVHRDTCTETPEKTYEIADLYQKKTGKKLRFCFDFSHIAVVKHLNPPYAERLLVRPDLVQFSRQVHFRPFNGHHCQVPATDGKGNETPEFKDYLVFVDAFIACWLKGAKGGEVLYACPEFGAGGWLRDQHVPERVEGRDPAPREDRGDLEGQSTQVEQMSRWRRPSCRGGRTSRPCRGS